MSAIDLENQEKFQQLQKVIDEWKDKEGPLMPVLHSAQEIFGCLSLDVQKLSLIHIFGYRKIQCRWVYINPGYIWSSIIGNEQG